MIISLLVGAAVLLLTFLFVETRVKEPLLPLSVFANRAFSIANLAAALLGFITVGAMFFLAQYFQAIQGGSALGSGLRLLPITLGIFLISPFSARLANSKGPRLPIVTGALLVATGFLLLMGLTPTSSYAVLWWQLSLLGIGIGLMFAPLTVAVVAATPAARAGLGSAMLNTFRLVGFALGTAILGAVVFLQFYGNIVSQLVQRGVPGATSAEIASKLASAGAQASHIPLSRQLPISPTVLHQVINQAFVYAMHSSFLISALCMIVTALLVLTIKRTTSPSKEKAASVTTTTNIVQKEEMAVPVTLDGQIG